MSISDYGARNKWAKWWWRSNSKDTSLYFYQLQGLFKSGVSLSHALSTLAESAPNCALRRASSEMTRAISEGKMWSDAMRRYPGLFSPLTLALIRSGESGGFLDIACGKLAVYSEKDYQIKQMIKRETWYPKMIILIMILFLNVPIFVLSILQHKPLLSALSKYSFGVGIPLLIISIIWLLSVGKNYMMPLVHHFYPLILVIDRIKLLVPAVSGTVRHLSIAKFCRAFGALNGAGIGIATALKLAADACGNEAIAASIHNIIPQVENGKDITDSLASTRQFQSTALQMMLTGEMSGNFEDQLNNVAHFMEQESETTIRKGVIVLGILVLIGTGVIVGIFVINFWMSYYGQLLSG